MSNTITQQLIMNSSRKYVILYNAQSDGSSGDISAGLFLKTTLDLPTTAKLARIWYSCASGQAITSTTGNTISIQLLWKATTNTVFWVMPAPDSHEMDFARIGGLTNPVNSGATGDVLITTSGFTTAGDSFSILAEFNKL